MVHHHADAIKPPHLTRCSSSAGSLNPNGLGFQFQNLPTERRLASGDADGRVVVWDVASGSIIAALDDALTAAHGRRPDALPPGRGAGVVAVAWVTAEHGMLGVAVAAGTFLVWDTRGEQTLNPKPCRLQASQARLDGGT